MEDRRCVRSGGYFIPINNPHLNEIRDIYKMTNPHAAVAKNMRSQGKYMPEVDPHVYACHTIPFWHKWGGALMIPRGVDLSRFGDLHHVSATSTGLSPSYMFREGIELRDYQADAVKKWDQAGREGVIVAPCGAGKTMMGLGAMQICDQKTIVLVHTSDLAVQWKERIADQLTTSDDWDQNPTGYDVKVTMYGNGKKDDTGAIVIASFQTLARMRFDELLEFGKQFGLCIVDEAHHVPAETFASVMFGMPARARLALTATPDRSDGLSNIMYWHFGPAVKTITTKAMIESGNVIAPIVQMYGTCWDNRKTCDWQKDINEMCADDDRNQKILDLVQRFVGEGRQVLVLSDRVKHCEMMAERTAALGFSAATLVGPMSKKKREEVLKLANAGEIRAMFATTVADEGLDLPSLDTLLLTTPTNSMGRVQQRIGRIMRRHKDKKKPLVIDFVDSKTKYWKKKNFRERFYTKLGCDVRKVSKEVPCDL